MPGRNRGKYWTVSLLKRRGWTTELIRELLPEPRYFASDGRSIRAWNKEEVRQAERSPQFSKRGREANRGDGPSKDQASHTMRACETLARAWSAADSPAGPPPTTAMS